MYSKSTCMKLVVLKVVILGRQHILPAIHAIDLEVIVDLAATREQVALRPLSEAARDLTNADLGHGHIVSVRHDVIIVHFDTPLFLSPLNIQLF